MTATKPRIARLHALRHYSPRTYECGPVGQDVPNIEIQDISGAREDLDYAENMRNPISWWIEAAMVAAVLVVVAIGAWAF